MPPPPNELEVLVGELQKKFERLKVLYEQYFMGIERVEPLVLRKDISRAVINLTGIHLRNPTLRFKVATFIQKWNIYQSYWNRTVRDIEAGRYARHVQTARRRAEREGLPFPAQEMGINLPAVPAEDPSASPPSDETPRDDVPEMRAQPRLEPARQRPPDERPLVPGMPDTEVRALHQRVVAAQRQSGDASEIRFETLVAQLNRQVPKLQAEHGCDEIRFDVVSRDGKVRLKPLTKKPG